MDRQLEDPIFDRAVGDPAYPPTYGHSDYFADPAYEDSLRRLLQMRAARPRR